MNVIYLYKAYHKAPQSTIVTLDLGLPSYEAAFLWISSTTFFPSTTLPKTTCFPSSHGHLTNVMKN